MLIVLQDDDFLYTFFIYAWIKRGIIIKYLAL